MPRHRSYSTTTSARSTPHASSTAKAATAKHYRPSSAWSSASDSHLLAVRLQGLNWLAIAARHFPSKTPNACRKRHERLVERRAGEDWDCVRLEVLASAYAGTRAEMWGVLAARVARLEGSDGVKWQDVEAKANHRHPLEGDDIVMLTPMTVHGERLEEPHSAQPQH